MVNFSSFRDRSDIDRVCDKLSSAFGLSGIIRKFRAGDSDDAALYPEPVIFWAPEETPINRHVLRTSTTPEPVIFWAPEACEHSQCHSPLESGMSLNQNKSYSGKVFFYLQNDSKNPTFQTFKKK
jgi:hypothetical protein